MTNIIGTGLSGLVGTRVVELNPQYQFTDLSLESGFNILKPKTLEDIFKNNPAKVVLHLAAFTDTNLAWTQRGDKAGSCYQVNVVGTQNMVNLCQKYGKHLIFISTDFVFDGTKTGPYIETDTPNPIEWYGQTKYEAEKMIQNSEIRSSIVRIAYPYRSHFELKPDIIRKIISKFENQEPMSMFADQLTTPTFIDDIALGLAKFINSKPTGVFHLVGSSYQSPYDMCLQIAEIFGFDKGLVKPSTLEEYIKNLPPDSRPWQKNLALSNQKVTDMGIKMKTLHDGLTSLKQQLVYSPLLRQN